eukprot:7095227-Ditylum_brightwellii.AAC.1
MPICCVVDNDNVVVVVEEDAYPMVEDNNDGGGVVNEDVTSVAPFGYLCREILGSNKSSAVDNDDNIGLGTVVSWKEALLPPPGII